MRVGRSILTSDGRVLLRAGTQLRDSYIKRLQQLGYDSIYVSLPGFEDVSIPEVIAETTRREAIRRVRQALLGVHKNRTLSYRLISESVRNIVDEVLQNPEVLIHTGDVRSHDEYTFGHSVNVAVLCTLIGRWMGYSPRQLHELATGGLLHDLGKIYIPSEILNKRGPLTPEERKLIENHPRDGFEVLRRSYEISLPAAHMAYQHHEALDGSGYPRRLRGDAIHPYALINAVADAFDALTVDRPYRRAVDPARAIEIISAQSGTRYDPRFVAALRAHVAPYPVSSRVVLNTGEEAIVVAVDRKAVDRPVVRIVARDGKELNPPYVEVSLKEREDLEIVGLRDDG